MDLAEFREALRIRDLVDETFGEKAVHWLEHPNRALGGEIPIQKLLTKEGRQQVEEILLRIEHGVFD